MSELNNHITSVQKKLQLLLRQYELLKADNAKQKEQLELLQTEKLEYVEQFAALHEQNLILKASVSEMAPAEKKELEQKLNQHIKNIDKCIALLSQ